MTSSARVGKIATICVYVAALVRGLGNRGLDPAAAAQARGSRCWNRPYRPAAARAWSGAARGPGARSPADPSEGRKPASRAAARRWSAAPAAGTPGQPAGGSCWSANPATGPAPPRFLSFAPAPEAHRGAQRSRRQPHRIDIGRRIMPGPGRMLMCPHHCRVRCHRPRGARRLIAPGPQPVQDHLPGPVPGPAAMPIIHGLPVPESPGQVPPRKPRPGAEEDPVQRQPVIIPSVPLPRMPRQQRLQPRPPTTGQVMPLQPLLIHQEIQPETTRQDLRDTP